MLFSITQLKGMRKVLFCLLEVLITVSITCLPPRYSYWHVNLKFCLPPLILKSASPVWIIKNFKHPIYIHVIFYFFYIGILHSKSLWTKSCIMVFQGEFYNYSGCGNTFNCNHPVVRQFIVDCLRLDSPVSQQRIVNLCTNLWMPFGHNISESLALP